MNFTSVPRAAAAALCVTLLLLAASAAQAQVVRAFTPRASFNQPGNAAMIGNMLMTCTDGANECEQARQRTATGANNNNNNHSMVFVDVDPAAGLGNSSSADLGLPPGATVSFAGLYWGARDAVAAPGRGTLQFRTPGSLAYQAINATQLDTNPFGGDDTNRAYMAFADVTALVQAGGNGTYTAGGIVGTTGTDRYAGWSLIVLYRDTNEPFRRLMVYDGAANVTTQNPSVTMSVSGLLTPLTGSFDTFLGALTWEGDMNLTGDQFLMDGNQLSDGLNPATNFWNSTISRLGSNLTDKSPNYLNQLGQDIDYVDASGILANGATGASFEFTSSGDAYYPHALVFAVDLFVPDLITSFTKQAVDVDGGELLPGDEVEYTVSFVNEGEDGALEVVVTDPIPANTTFVPGSLEILGNAPGASTGAMTDAAGDDEAEFAAGPDRVVFRLGAGADSTSGGQVLPDEAASFRFRVVVDDDQALAETDIVNTARIDYISQTLDEPFDGESSATVTVAPIADLSIVKTGEDAVTSGDETVYQMVVTNNGPSAADGAVVTDPGVPDSLECTALACSAAGGAACPAAPTPAQLVAGLAIPTLPNGGSVTLELTCTVTATGN
ncbi:DUF11 domain-containing protein [Luteimonas sp. RD2P54]|uniref:DUF11 domain-containing protein n=1 Tax=Luteimonas endophytica TaxID=3042023 RepID=A0ABT6JBB5_9GAMM|nr:DUF11 domain-containing protein [Luteimonas endophytica]MDH5823897.1 DUF11 domain-containing protein [Luteimonas endophytica]